jgi:anaphase-promoting complex subunit 4
MGSRRCTGLYGKRSRLRRLESKWYAFLATLPGYPSNFRVPGRNIMIAHHPPKLTLHSLESGKEIHAIPISLRSPSAKLSAIWWRDIPGGEHSSEPFPDIVRRRGHDVCPDGWLQLMSRSMLISPQPGSVHSLLSHLPPLDLGSDDVGSPR